MWKKVIKRDEQTDTSSKQAYSCPVRRWKDALHHYNQGNANRNNERAPHTSENGTHEKEQKQPMLVRMWGKKETLIHCWWRVNCFGLFGRQYGHSSKKMKDQPSMWPGNFTSWNLLQVAICVPMFIAALLTIVKIWQIIRSSPLPSRHRGTQSSFFPREFPQINSIDLP